MSGPTLRDGTLLPPAPRRALPRGRPAPRLWGRTGRPSQTLGADREASSSSYVVRRSPRTRSVSREEEAGRAALPGSRACNAHTSRVCLLASRVPASSSSFQTQPRKPPSPGSFPWSHLSVPLCSHLVLQAALAPVCTCTWLWLCCLPSQTHRPRRPGLSDHWTSVPILTSACRRASAPAQRNCTVTLSEPAG